MSFSSCTIVCWIVSAVPPLGKMRLKAGLLAHARNCSRATASRSSGLAGTTTRAGILVSFNQSINRSINRKVSGAVNLPASRQYKNSSALSVGSLPIRLVNRSRSSSPYVSSIKRVTPHRQHDHEPTVAGPHETSHPRKPTTSKAPLGREQTPRPLRLQG